MSSLFRDFRYAFRSLRRQPAFAATVVATLALGLGANSAVFSIVDALVLRPFPIPGVERLTMMWETIPERGEDRGAVSPANFLDWRAQTTVFGQMAAFEWWDANLTGGDRPERIQGTRATPGFLRMLGVEPALGRTLPDAERDDSLKRGVVLSHRLWTQRFGGDPSILGKPVLLDGETYDVVGVAAKDFDYPYGTDVWAPLVFGPEEAAERDKRYLEVIGRLKDGVTVQQAENELTLVAARLATEHPAENAGRGARLLALNRAVIDIGAPAFLAVWQATVLFVLLIACVNVANLLLVRGADRRREVALRLALGAGRRQVVRQLMTENLLLSLTGAAASLPLAWVGVHLLRTGLPERVRRYVVGWDQIDVDTRLLLFTAAAAVGAALLFGLLPAWSASRQSLVGSLRESGRGTLRSGGRMRGRSLLVVGEVALALMLLVASGLTIRGTLRLVQGDQGFRPDGLITMELELPENAYKEESRRAAFYESLVEKVQRLPTVQSADVTNVVPSGFSNSSRSLEVEGRPVERRTELPSADFRVISSGYFATMGIPMKAGRAFDTRDRSDTSPTAVVSALAAEKLWPGEDPLGKRFRIDGEKDAPWRIVVGVCDDVIQNWFLGGARATFYLPLAQSPRLGMHLVARVAGKPESVVPAIRAELAKLDPNQPVFNIISMNDLLVERTIGLRYAAVMMGVFGLIALALAAVGLYGLMAYTVRQRSHEIGVRVALGADRRAILGLTLRRAAVLTGLGVAIGLLLSLGAGRLMESSLFGTVSLDPETFAFFALVLTLVSLAASLIPARRALKIDPAAALRLE